mmetsp:Transcript_29538/g.90573  ORF Transcript_29538/g.90573 Transcript_29538/m.90573 type:complete len:231 (-) Transcript_29538:694-1386(-)
MTNRTHRSMPRPLSRLRCQSRLRGRRQSAPTLVPTTTRGPLYRTERHGHARSAAPSQSASDIPRASTPSTRNGRRHPTPSAGCPSTSGPRIAPGRRTEGAWRGAPRGQRRERRVSTTARRPTSKSSLRRRRPRRVPRWRRLRARRRPHRPLPPRLPKSPPRRARARRSGDWRGLAMDGGPPRVARCLHARLLLPAPLRRTIDLRYSQPGACPATHDIRAWRTNGGPSPHA